MGWAKFRAIFSQAHPVTLPAGQVWTCVFAEIQGGAKIGNKKMAKNGNKKMAQKCK
jgi:hypothetical protein